MSTHERLQRDCMMSEMKCWDEMRRFSVTHKRQHAVFELILQWVARYSATHLVLHVTATCVWVQSSWHWRPVTASAACVVRPVAVADWWRTWPMANTLAWLCSCQWWTFWTCLVTVNLFSLYLMSFMFHTTLYAVGNILTVNYKNMKCDVSVPQGSVSYVI